jgi:flagella basal body P-ring formation protein FlgA
MAMNSIKNLSLVLGLSLAASLSAAAGDQAAPAVSWQLQPEARVDSSGLFLNQIVKSTPPVALPQIRLAPAPPVGQTVFFSRSQILDLAQGRLAGLSITNWTGAARVKVTRRSRQLDEPEMTTLLTAVIQSNYVKNMGELELRFARSWTPLLVPDEPLTVRITEVPTAGLNPDFLAGFELWNGPERIARCQEVLQARIWRQIPVAHSRLERGQLLRDADVTMERRDLLTQRDVVLAIPAENDSLELAESVAVGMPVPNRAVRPRPLIKRGQMIDAIFEDGDLKISLKVESLQDGALGQTVRVLNPKTHRELYGKVQNEESISIAL